MGTMGFQPGAFIGVFDHTCRQEFLETGFLTQFWMKRPDVMVGWFDKGQRPKEWWMQVEPHIPLLNKIGNPQNCPEIVYLPPNYLINEALGKEMSRPYTRDMVKDGIRMWNPKNGGSLRDFFWENMDIDVTIINNRNTEVSVANKHLKVKSVGAGEEVVFRTFIGEIITVDGEVFHPVERRNLQIIVEEDEMDLSVGFYTPQQTDKWHDLLGKRHQFTSFSCASNVYIPPKIPNFTKTGYKLIRMPKEMLTKLENYFNAKYHTKRDETFFDGYTIINSYQHYPGFVSLYQHEANKMIGKELRELVGEWSGIPEHDLELTSFYGIREYHDDHFLRCHVDRSQTHVLSTILHIASEDMREPWPVEVVGFDGKRQTINMKHGDLLFYESAKLIHGRPKYLKADKFINAFAHYRPRGAHKYLWGYNSRNDAIYDPENKLIVDVKLDRLTRQLRTGHYDDYYNMETNPKIHKNHWKDEL